MILTVVKALLSWKIESGYEILRWLSKENLDEVDMETADIIGDNIIYILKESINEEDILKGGKAIKGYVEHSWENYFVSYSLIKTNLIYYYIMGTLILLIIVIFTIVLILKKKRHINSLN